jgi:uncharacterized protein
VARSGHVVAYMGDDERFDYLYKFVSAKRYKPGDRRHNLTLLESGTLYVARCTGDSPSAEIDGTGKLPSDGLFDGTGQWIKLVWGDRSYVPGMTAIEALTFTRLAGDAVQATKMDRPEDVQPSLITGKIYAAMTNNVNRGVGTNAGPDEANPRKENKHGQIFELVENGGDHTAESSTGRCRSSAVTPPTRRRTSPGMTSPRCRRSPARTTSPSTAPATCGSPPTAMPWNTTTDCSPPPSRDLNAVT